MYLIKRAGSSVICKLRNNIKPWQRCCQQKIKTFKIDEILNYSDYIFLLLSSWPGFLPLLLLLAAIPSLIDWDI
jgi:hypothetical protein